MMDEAFSPCNENRLPGLLKAAHSNRGKWYSPCNSPLAFRVKSPESDVPTLKLAHFAKIPRISFGKVKVGFSKSKRLVVRNPNPLAETLTFDKSVSSKGFTVSCKNFSSDDCPSSEITATVEPDDEVLLTINWEPKEHGSCREIIRFMWNDSHRLQVIVFGTAVEPTKAKSKVGVPSVFVVFPGAALYM